MMRGRQMLRAGIVILLLSLTPMHAVMATGATGQATPMPVACPGYLVASPDGVQTCYAPAQGRLVERQFGVPVVSPVGMAQRVAHLPLHALATVRDLPQMQPRGSSRRASRVERLILYIFARTAPGPHVLLSMCASPGPSCPSYVTVAEVRTTTAIGTMLYRDLQGSNDSTKSVTYGPWQYERTLPSRTPHRYLELIITTDVSRATALGIGTALAQAASSTA